MEKKEEYNETVYLLPIHGLQESTWFSLEEEVLHNIFISMKPVRQIKMYLNEMSI
jgi:hypothetical protein